MKIYNSMTRQKETFKPLKAGEVSMYVCGMTVYDYCHLGHARMLVAFDVIVRYMRARGLKVNYVRNITDIDDKIIKRAHEIGEDPQALANRFIDEMHADLNALGVLPPNDEPRATETIDYMINMIQTLIDKDYAYVADSGDVCFAIEHFEDYGKLSRKDIEGQEQGARVAVSDSKRHPLDFVLWKPAKPGEPAWSSPWGDGRPGWHIECSAMSSHYLGDHFDIHGGGADLIFPHHENEIAQSCAASGEKFVNTWMHVGYLQVDKEKMSKSLGNFFTVRDVLADYPAEAVRYFLSSSHYRSQLNYTAESLEAAANSLQRLYLVLRDIEPVTPSDDFADDLVARFYHAMDDDFNTPDALAVIFECAHRAQQQREQGDMAAASHYAGLLKKLGNMLGLVESDPQAYLQGEVSGITNQEIEDLITAREKARADRDWSRADAIRDQLLAAGVALEDSSGGTTWRRV